VELGECRAVLLGLMLIDRSQQTVELNRVWCVVSVGTEETSDLSVSGVGQWCWCGG